jgi:hypothetical protein
MAMPAFQAKSVNEAGRFVRNSRKMILIAWLGYSCSWPAIQIALGATWHPRYIVAAGIFACQ